MKYLIKLKPLDKFFFGREQTFADDNYLAKSHYMPQQTQILGMLRKELLIQHGLLTRKRRGEWVDEHNYDQAKKLVGIERYDIASTNKPDLGTIKSLSPLFLVDKDDALFYFSAKDYGLQLNSVQNNIPELVFRDSQKLYKEKDAKKLHTVLMSKEKTYNIDEVFLLDEQVGIKKNREGGSDDNAFFKKSSYKLKKEFSFAFVLNIDTTLDDAIVSLGGERSLFEMKVIKEHTLCNSYEDKTKEMFKADPVSKLILLSDTYIDERNEDIFNNSSFAITDTVALRTINSKVTKRKSGTKRKDIDQKEYKFQKSITYNFFKQGSVFYSHVDKLEELIKNDNLQTIGYNKYTTIKGESNE
jgi:CRISPR-associated protein Cmr3